MLAEIILTPHGDITSFSKECSVPVLPHDNHRFNIVSVVFFLPQKMTLISRCACIGGCGFPILPRGMSLGSFLLLLFLVLVLTYLLVGYLYRRCVVGARGIELMPHLSFWREFPYLVQVRNIDVFFLYFEVNGYRYLNIKKLGNIKK